MGRFITTISINLNFTGYVQILDGYLDVMILKYREKIIIYLSMINMYNRNIVK